MLVGVTCPKCHKYTSTRYGKLNEDEVKLKEVFATFDDTQFKEKIYFLCERCLLILDPPDGLGSKIEVISVAASSK